MAAVVRDDRDGRWLARWRDPGGRQRKKSFTRRVDAQRWLDQLQASAHRGQYIAPAAGKTKLVDVAAGWGAGLAHLKPSTRARYRSILRYHVVPQWGTWSVGDIRRSEVTAWIAELVESGRRPGTVRQIHRVLSLVLDVAVDDALIGQNPAARVRLPRQVRAEPCFLSAEEVARLAAAADRNGNGPDGLVVAVLALTGLRFGELAALRVARVDLTRRRLAVAESVTEVGGTLVWTTPKSHQTRSVPFPPSLLPALTDQSSGRQSDDLLFTAAGGGALRLNNWRRRVFDPARAAAGLTRVRPHDLRHTAASLAIGSGANPKAVQRMLGHASAAMTLDVYAGLFADDLDSVAVALDAFVPPLRHGTSPSNATEHR
jgi:integrase